MTPAVAIADRLRTSFEGEVLGPGDAGYDEGRRVWSALIDRRPAVIARPTTVAGVVAAVRFARENDLRIAVRGGGHGMTGLSTCDDGIVVDLSRMRGVTVDPRRATAQASGGAHLLELDRAAQAHGLVCPIGVVGHTGIGGLALGGGVGRLQRRFGLTVDSITAVELVTADGRHVRASEDEDPELFWAIRGAGPNFGIVTSLELRLHPFGPNLTRGYSIYRAVHAHALWDAFRAFGPIAPRELTASYVLGRAVPAEDYPPEIAGGPIVVIGFAHTGTEAAARDALAPLLGAAEPVVATIATRPYLEIQTSADDSMAWGQRFCASGGFVGDLGRTTIGALLDHLADGVGDPSFTASLQGGAIADTSDDAMAYTGHAAPYRVLAECLWTDSADDAAAIAWCRRAFGLVSPDLVPGRYVNEIWEDETDPATIYGPDKLRRLVALKRAWDPDNVFRHNHNIRP